MLVHRSFRTPCQANKSVAMLPQQAGINTYRTMRAFLQMGSAYQRHEISISGFIFHQQRKAVGQLIICVKINRQSGPDNGLNAERCHSFGKFQGTKQIIAVGHCQRRHAHGLGGARQQTDRQCPFKQ